VERVIFHCDLNSFYASVELLEHPELRHLPVAVCGDPDSRHGIILAKNEPAKGYGVKTAETIWQAKQKCPELQLLAAHHGKYHHYSKLVNAIYQEYTDLVEPFGIDESFLDVTGTLHLFGGDGKKLADELRDRIRRELGLTISVGVSFNKVFAKLGSDYKKPDATTVFDRESVPRLIHPMPVSSLLYVGRSAAKTLESMYIRTIGELAHADRAFVAARLGKMGEMIHDYANGLDDSPVAHYGEGREVKSVGNGITFPRDLVGYDEIHTGAVLLADTVAARLRQSGRYATVVQVTLKNPELVSVQRQMGVHPTDLARDIVAAAMQLVRTHWGERAPLRMLTVTASGLTDERESAQLSLFDEDGDDYERQSRIASAMDSIRLRFGNDAITPATTLHNEWEKH